MQMQRYILGWASLYMAKCSNIKSYKTLHPILSNFHVLFAVLQFKYIQKNYISYGTITIQQLSDAKYNQQQLNFNMSPKPFKAVAFIDYLLKMFSFNLLFTNAL